MNRLQFFSEMKKGLVDTVKEVTFPVLSEEVVRIEDAIEKAQGISWTKVGNIHSIGTHEDYILNGQPVAVFASNQTYKALRTICPDCETVVQWISYQEKFTCFSCQHTYEIHNEDNQTLKLMELPVKIIDENLFVGFYT